MEHRDRAPAHPGIGCHCAAIDEGLDYAVGQRISQPVYAKVAFQIPDPKRTAADREAARAKVPSHYVFNDPALTSDRIRSELMRLYQLASEKTTYEEFSQAVENQKAVPDRAGYDRFRELADRGEAGLRQFQELVDKLPLEDQYIVSELANEDRVPPSTEKHIILNNRGDHDSRKPLEILYVDLDSQKSKKDIGDVAAALLRVPDPRLRQTVERGPRGI
jgi:hypothetical protein